MRDQGAYTQLWRKYLPVIRLLLKKTENSDQKLQLYKHEFEKTGAKNKLGYVFSLEITNGKAIKNTAKIAVSYDLLTVLNENDLVAAWLKGKIIKITVARSCELTLNQTIKEEIKVESEEVEVVA